MKVGITYPEHVDVYEVEVFRSDFKRGQYCLDPLINEALVYWATERPDQYREWVADAPGSIDRAEFDELLLSIPQEFCERAGFRVKGHADTISHLEHNGRTPIRGATYRELYDLGVL